MALNFDSSGVLSVNGTTMLSFNASGHPVINKPAFRVRQSTLPTSIGSDIIFNAVDYNTGSHYNNTNGRFTAPIAGVYYVAYRQLPQNADDPGAFVFGIYVNGTERIRETTRKALDNTWNSNMFSSHVYLAANDYITVRFIAGTTGATTYTDANYNVFFGFLVA